MIKYHNQDAIEKFSKLPIGKKCSNCGYFQYMFSKCCHDIQGKTVVIPVPYPDKYVCDKHIISEPISEERIMMYDFIKNYNLREIK